MLSSMDLEAQLLKWHGKSHTDSAVNSTASAIAGSSGQGGRSKTDADKETRGERRDGILMILRMLEAMSNLQFINTSVQWMTSDPCLTTKHRAAQRRLHF